EEFQQAGEQGSRAQGTGLGLALARRLVHAHAGRIELESTLGQGAKFTVYLPVGAVAAGAGDNGVAAPCPTGILIIEDDPGAAQLLSAYLETAGYRVSVAGTAEQGLATARACAPDAILLDLRLPGMN